MKIYYLINTDLGWDSICAMATSIKGVFQDYYKDEDVPETDEECEKIFRKDNLILLDRIINN